MYTCSTTTAVFEELITTNRFFFHLHYSEYFGKKPSQALQKGFTNTGISLVDMRGVTFYVLIWIVSR